MINTQQNILWQEDEKLFKAMRGRYISDKEQEFFEKQEHKQKYNMTISNDLIMSEFNNEDHIYIVRCRFDEYIVGSDSGEEHFMNLFETLNSNLKEKGILNRNITLLQWLRDRNYQGVEYEHNFDNL